MICDRVVSSPTLVALNLIKPVLFILAPITLSPIFFSTGILSPVIMDSSIEVLPSTISPSTGRLCPGLTIIISPTLTSSTGTSSISPFFSTKAILGAKFMSFSIASEVLPLALPSKNLPKVIKVRITPADSKYRSWEYLITNSMFPVPRPVPILYIAKTPYKAAAPVPTATKESIFGFLFHRVLNPIV